MKLSSTQIVNKSNVTGASITDALNKLINTVGDGSGDMLKSIYDTDNDGIVDQAAIAATVPYAGITGKPATFPPTAHNHTISEVTGLTSSLSEKVSSAALLDAGGADLVGYINSGAGAVATTVQAKLREFVSVKDFGAVGDGVTDDTAAIQAAITANAGGKIILPSDHVFLSGPLTVSNPMSICIDGTLKMRDSSGTLITISGDDVTIFGTGLIDLNSTQDKGIQITGQRPHVHGLTLANMLGGAATSGSSSALNIANTSGVYGARVHNLTFRNIQKGAAPAPYVSQPRAMSFDFARKAFVSDILCEDVFCCAGVGAVQDSTFSNITVNNSLAIADNCLYIIDSSRCVFDNFIVREWAGEPIVFSDSSDITFNGGEIRDAVDNSCGFENSMNIAFIGTRFYGSNSSTVLKSRAANTESSGISLIGVRAQLSGTSDLLTFYNGAVNDVIVKGCVFEGRVDTGKTLNNVMLKMVTTNRFVIEDNTFILSEASSGAASAADWTITLATSEYSTFKRNTLVNRTAAGRFRVLGTENNLIASDGLFNQANITGSRNPNYGLSTAEPRRFFGTSAPTAGTFVLADSVENTAPGSSAILGWVCVAAGTPGTWVPFGGSFLSGTSVYNPPSLADGAGTTTTVSVPGAALGDIAAASFGQALQDVTVTAWVSAANTVSVRFQNESGSTVDLAQGTIRARVWKV